MKLRFLTKAIWKKVFGKNMRFLGCGTTLCKKEIVEFYLDLGMNFVDVYGSTETGLPTSATNITEKYPVNGSGKVDGLPYVKIKLANVDREGKGEIMVKTKLIMKGYFKDSELTDAVFDDDGYFHTGDIGYIDNNNNLFMVGRMKESIILRNGKKVSPMEIDEFYKACCPEIAIASCGIPTDEGVDEIHLFIEKEGIPMLIFSVLLNK